MKGRSMYNSSTLIKQEFLKKWIKGVQLCNTFKKDMSILDRKRTIKMTADVAIASTRDAKRTQWSRALISDIVSSNEANRIIIEQISDQEIRKKSSTVACSKKILRKSHRKARRVVPHGIITANRIIIEQISDQGIRKKSSTVACSKNILRKSHRKARRVGPHGIITASSIAKKLVKNRTRMLKALVPGGKEMDDVSLIRETLDYIMSLRVQVEVMRHLNSAAEKFDASKSQCN